MHIKKITIRGFKSYREEVVVDDVSPHHVALLGFNGAGKSNFFQAIQFVLCDSKFDKLRKEERIDLLHQVRGAQSLPLCQ